MPSRSSLFWDKAGLKVKGNAQGGIFVPDEQKIAHIGIAVVEIQHGANLDVASWTGDEQTDLEIFVRAVSVDPHGFDAGRDVPAATSPQDREEGVDGGFDPSENNQGVVEDRGEGPAKKPVGRSSLYPHVPVVIKGRGLLKNLLADI